MIQGIIIKKVLDLVMKQLMKKVKLEKFDKILDYVEKPNDLDKHMKQSYKNIAKQGRYIEELEKDVAILKKYSHPSQEFICCKRCGCKINKIKK